MKFKNLIFDLDGTLWDSRKSIVVNWNLVLSEYNLLQTPIVEADMNKYMGLLIDDVLRDMYPDISDEILKKVIQDIKKIENKSLIENGGILYKGVDETLRSLKNGHNLFIVSNCQDGYIESFLKYFGFEELFSDYESYGKTGKPKSENIRLLMERNKLSIYDSVYIGDTETDYKAAASNNLEFIFCNYGFGYVDSDVHEISELAELSGYI